MIDRYLEAVRFWLPASQQEDIVAELREDLQAEVTDREMELGRELTDADLEDVLRRRGSPLKVAGQYLPQRSLIGPLLFPLYWLVLRIATVCLVGFMVLGWMAMALSRGLSGGTSTLTGVFMGVDVGALISAWLPMAAIVTLLFAVLERSEVKRRLVEEWDLRKLPTVKPRYTISRSSSVAEMAVMLCVAVWWAVAMRSPLREGAVIVSLSGSWYWLYWVVLLLVLATLGLAAVNAAKPWKTRTRMMCRTLLEAGGASAFCWALQAGMVSGITWPGASAAATAALVRGINHGLHLAFPVAVMVGLGMLAVNVYQMVRLGEGPGTIREEAAAKTDSNTCG